MSQFVIPNNNIISAILLVYFHLDSNIRVRKDTIVLKIDGVLHFKLLPVTRLYGETESKFESDIKQLVLASQISLSKRTMVYKEMQ